MAGGRPSFSRDAAFFVALFATALALGPALAHALELANKMAMTREDYFTVQRIYLGWSRLGYLLLIQLLGILAVIVLHRREPAVLRPAAAALVCLFAAQALFWSLTFPANQATQNWSLPSEHWADLREQWEYSHLGGAALQALAMAALIIAVLRRARAPTP